MSDFFEPPPREERESSATQDWNGAPAGVVPVTVPIERVVARTPTVAVYLASISAYPSGFEFDVFVVADEQSGLDPFSFDHNTVARRTGEIPPGQLRLGFLFADGSKAANTGKYVDWHDENDAQPDAPVMTRSGGQSGENSWHSSLWVWPLPPPGRFEFRCEWPEAEIPLTRCDLDADPLIAGASRAQYAFPRD